MNPKETQPENREYTGRNPDGTFKAGVSGNPGGRPKGTLKEYMKQKFIEMSYEEKEAFIKNIQAIDQWRMAEGNPQTNTDVTTKGEAIGSTVTDDVLVKASEMLKEKMLNGETKTA
jgi:hypothetical protein